MMDFPQKHRVEDVLVTRATEKALLCTIDNENVWVPQSQIDDDSEVYKLGDEGTLIVSLWYARQKGWD